MHSYSTDSEERTNVPLALVLLSVAAAWSLRHFLDQLQLSLPWWLDAPSVMGFYAVMHFVFDRILWRFQILRTLGICKIPDISGTWEGSLRSSLNNFRYDRGIEAVVTQTWSQIRIQLKTKSSTSRSLIASFLTAGDIGTVLSYQYLNEPSLERQLESKVPMHAHRGTAWLNVSEDLQTLEGEYHTGRDRKNFGTMTLRRKSHSSESVPAN